MRGLFAGILLLIALASFAIATPPAWALAPDSPPTVIAGSTGSRLPPLLYGLRRAEVSTGEPVGVTRRPGASR